MGRPQDQRLQRSGNTPLDPDHLETEVEVVPHAPRDEPSPGPVPPENRQGHHPAHEQDKPDLDKFAERLGVTPDDANGGSTNGAGDSNGSRPTLGDGVEGIKTVFGRAQELAQPVAHVVQVGFGKVTHAIEERRHLAERFHELESRVEDLERQIDKLSA